MTVSYADVQTARRILAGAALRTPKLPSPKGSSINRSVNVSSGEELSAW
jgi:hypothetical protein